MSLLRTLIILCLTALAALPARGQAQEPTQEPAAEPSQEQISEQAQQVVAIWEAYKQLDYEQVEKRASQALTDFQAFSTEQLTQIHAVLGLVQFAQNKPEAARQQFEAALTLSPAHRLDPLLVSPKVMTFFERVRREMLEEENVAEEPPPLPPVRYILLEDPRPAAALRSAVLPGWGQLYKQEPREGYLLMGLWGTALSGAAVAHLVRAQARDAYQDARDPAVIEERYGTYNGWHRTRNAFLIGAGLVWAYSYYDALLSWDRPEAAARSLQDVQVRPAPTFPFASLHLRLRF